MSGRKRRKEAAGRSSKRRWANVSIVRNRDPADTVGIRTLLGAKNDKAWLGGLNEDLSKAVEEGERRSAIWSWPEAFDVELEDMCFLCQTTDTRRCDPKCGAVFQGPTRKDRATARRLGALK